MKRSNYAVVPSAQEFDQAKIAKHLQLLPDFVSDVVIARIDSTQRGLASVDFR